MNSSDILQITPIKAFRDNYLWLFNKEGSREACIVDPGDAEPVLEHLERHGIELAAIFVTHHHADHIGGLDTLLDRWSVPVYAPPGIPRATDILHEGDSVRLFGVDFSVFEVPGHTLDHIAYYAPEPVYRGCPVLFCGDTLFAGGCGRLFEGTPPMMYRSLQRLAGLNPDTRFFCAHEYTLANLDFALAVTPEHAALQSRRQLEAHRRNQDIPTVPGTIDSELQTNPFLRCTERDVIEAANRHAGRVLDKPEDVFATVRAWKDSF